jgi:hypothetical protein
MFTSELDTLVRAKPHRYIDGRHGDYMLREGNGAPVMDANGFPIRPPEPLVDQLVDEMRLVYEDSKYRPRPLPTPVTVHLQD